MKFSEMPYTRPDLGSVKSLTAETLAKIQNADSAQAQADAFRAYDTAMQEVGTNFSLAHVRHTIDTRDAFYDQEIAYADEIMPSIGQLTQQVNQAILQSKFRSELETLLGRLLFVNLDLSARSFNEKNLELMQEENKLKSRYQKLCASAMIDFDGKQLTLPQLGPYKTSTDRAVRQAALEAEGRWYDSHQEEFDQIFDQMVKNRTQQARNLGHENFIPMGYDRFGRNCYGPREVASFREQIARDMVPVVVKAKANQAKRLGVDQLKLWDDGMFFPDGNAVPQGTAEELLATAHQMYRDISPETAEFADFLWGNELLDVLSKPGKAGGGYCTAFDAYKATFLFSNFNGTSHDADVLLHEAGHAFAGYRILRQGYLSALKDPTAESCETHSTTMEFLTTPWHDRLFGPLTRKYDVGHTEGSLSMFPYVCMVDEFQHEVYAHPDMTPAQRNELWLKLEAKYRPWLDLGDLPFYGRGAGWQRQAHIFGAPFYYIDYAISQAMALQFWVLSMADWQDAWDRYIRFVDFGGTKTFEELAASADLKVPYAPGAIREIGEAVSQWIDENPL